MQGVVGSLITTSVQINQGIFRWKKIENRIRFYTIIAVVSLSLRPTLYMYFNGGIHTYAALRAAALAFLPAHDDLSSMDPGLRPN